MRVLRFLPFMLLIALGVAPSARAGGDHDYGGGRITTIASGLDSPRHLAFGSRGDLFVAEAGRGGPGPCFAAGEGPACIGATGAVTKIDRWGRQSRIATGLASMANTPGNDSAIGPHGIIVVGSDKVLITNGGPTEPLDPAGNTILRETLAAQNPVANLFGKVLLITPQGSAVQQADIWDFERRVNPDAAKGNPKIDSNAVDLLLDGSRLVVADAGGNAIDTVDPWSDVSNLTVFENRLVPDPFNPKAPQIPMQAVPTSVEEGPDGQYYVGQLTGFPFPARGANVYRVNPRTGKQTVVADGFTNIMDLAFGSDGTLYVLEIDQNGLLAAGDEGALFTVSRRGDKRQIKLPPGTLPAPGGLTVGDDALYVSINSRSPGGGQVLRIRNRDH
jgi:sugar lactone lactonase YvrE